MSKDRRLGRGLAALLGAPGDDEIVPPVHTSVPAPQVPLDSFTEKVTAHAGETVQLGVYDIDDNPYQPRRDFGEQEIASLAESLKTHDMLQPILVRKLGSRYQLISGERRLRAAILAGWKTVPVRVREADDRLVAELAIVENLQRKDLNPIEKALSFKRYIDEHRCTQDELANRLKIDRSHVANLLRLLELPAAVMERVRSGELTAGHAKALLQVGDDRTLAALADRAVSQSLSVRDVESLVQAQLAMEDGEPITEENAVEKPKRRTKRTDQLGALEMEFFRALGVKVEISSRTPSKGKIIIHYKSHEDFARVREQISGQKSALEIE